MQYVIYNQFSTGLTPTQWKVFNDSSEASKEMFKRGDDWDITNIDTFRTWWPGLIPETT